MKYLSGKYLKTLKRIGLYLELSALTAGIFGCGVSGQMSKKDYDVPEEVVKDLEDIQKSNDIVKDVERGTEQQQRELKIMREIRDLKGMEIEGLLRAVEREYNNSLKKT